MRRMRRYLCHGATAMLVVLVAATLTACGASAAQVKRVAEKTFDFEPGGEVVIESQNGRIVVDAWDRPKARLQVTRSVRAPDDRQAEELMQSLRSDVEISPKRIEIVSRYPQRRETSSFWDFLGRKVAAMDIHYYLQVPRETALSLETSNGEIRIRGTTRAVDAHTTNGDVRVSGAGGTVQAWTTNGGIELLDVSGSVEGTTTNGSVRAEVRSLDRRLGLFTTNGNVTLRLPAATKARLKAATTNGKVETAFPITADGVRSSKTIEGAIGGGGSTTIELITTNGSIRILKSGERDRS